MDAHKNFATSTVAVAPVTATAGTALTVASGHGARFPATPFNMVICPVGALADPSNAEIVRVTAIVGDVLTITRTQESTSARTVITGDRVYAGITAKTLTDVETVDAAAGTGSLRTLGTSSTSAAAGNDSRLSDMRTPTDATVSMVKLTSAARDAILPWTIQVLPFTNDAAAKTGTWTPSLDSAYLLNGYTLSSGAQNDLIAYDLILAAGTWTFSLLFQKNSNCGIYTVTLDGTSAGTIDGYNASSSKNQTATITGISVTTSAKVRVALKAATKNASSSGYYLVWQMFQMLRTA